MEAGEAIKDDEEAAAVAMVGSSNLILDLFPTNGGNSGQQQHADF